jgi:hypothetical protein
MSLSPRTVCFLPIAPAISLSLSLSLSLLVKLATRVLDRRSPLPASVFYLSLVSLPVVSLLGGLSLSIALCLALSIKPPLPAGVPQESWVSPSVSSSLCLALSLSLTVSLCRSLSHSSGRRREQARPPRNTDNQPKVFFFHLFIF